MTSTAAKAKKQSKTKEQEKSTQHWSREGVESIIIAIVLALLFRTFEAEAFVIPTGSMAPTLQGRHKDVACPECGYRYRTSMARRPPYSSVRSPSGSQQEERGFVQR